MKKNLLIIIGIVLLIACFYLLLPNNDDLVVTSSQPHVTETLKPSEKIPAGKGGLTEQGKYQQAPVQQLDINQSEQAIEKLKKSLNIEDLGNDKFRIGLITVDRSSRVVSLPATVNMSDGAIEYALTTNEGKKHEALFTSQANPTDLHMACLLMSIKNSAEIRVTVSWESNGPPVKHPLASLIALRNGDPSQAPQGTLQAESWKYSGSRFTADGAFAAQTEGGFISLIEDGSALISNPSDSRKNDEVHTPNTQLLPREGFPVTIHINLPSI